MFTFRLPKPPELVGALEPNEQLTHAETLLLGRIYGPESIVLHRRSRTVYTGLRNGYIVKIRVNDSKKVRLIRTFCTTCLTAQLMLNVVSNSGSTKFNRCGLADDIGVVVLESFLATVISVHGSNQSL